MIRLEKKKQNTILTEKQQKHQHHHQIKLINEIHAGEKNITI